MIKLSKRLKCILSLLKGYVNIADIGCDHGKVLGYIVQNCDYNFLVGSDISKQSAQKTKILLNNLHCKNFDVRVGNGLSTISNNDNIEIAVIAGMGGLEIINILNDNKINLFNFILQPQNNEYELRKFLTNNNYSIIYDEIIFEKGQFYHILKTEKGYQSLNLNQLCYGINYNKFSVDRMNYYYYIQQKLLNRIKNIKDKEIKLKNQLKLNEINDIINIVERSGNE